MEILKYDYAKDLYETIQVLDNKNFNTSSLFVYIQINDYNIYFKEIVMILKEIKKFDNACEFLNISFHETLFILISDICCNEKISGFIFINPLIYHDVEMQQLANKYKIFKKHININNAKKEKIYISGRISLPKIIDIKFIDENIYSMNRILISGNTFDVNEIFDKHRKIFKQKIDKIKFNLIAKCKNNLFIDCYTHECIQITNKNIIFKIKCRDDLDRCLSYIYNANIESDAKKKFFNSIDDNNIWNEDIAILKNRLENIFL